MAKKSKPHFCICWNFSKHVIIFRFWPSRLFFLVHLFWPWQNTKAKTNKDKGAKKKINHQKSTLNYLHFVCSSTCECTWVRGMFGLTAFQIHLNHSNFFGFFFQMVKITTTTTTIWRKKNKANYLWFTFFCIEMGWTVNTMNRFDWWRDTAHKCLKNPSKTLISAGISKTFDHKSCQSF